MSKSIMKEIKTADMQQTFPDGSVGPIRAMCFEQAIANFVRRAVGDTNPKIVRMKGLPHWFYQSEETTIQPYELLNVFQPYIGPTASAPQELRKSRPDRKLMRRAEEILSSPALSSVREIYEDDKDLFPDY